MTYVMDSNIISYALKGNFEHIDGLKLVNWVG